MNLALGSAGTGYTNYTAPDSNFSSATMYVDYVRAYSYNGETVTTTGEYPDGYTRASNDASWHDAGTAWSYYFNNSWANVDAAYKGGDSLNDFSVYMIKKSTENWGAQLKPKLSLDANSTYNYSFKIQMDSGGNSLHIKYEKSGTDQSLVNGTLSSGVNSYSGTFTTGSSTSGQIVFDLYGLTKGSTMTITEFAVWKNGETTTQAPTTTTAKPTTTVAPTTTTAPVTTTYSTLTPTDTVPTDSWGTFGIYKCYTGTWAGTNTAKAAVDPVNDSHIIVQKTDNNYNNAWLIQVKLELPELKDSYETGKYYYEWPIRLNGSDYSSKVLSSDGTNGDNNGTDIAPGYQTITGEIEIDKNNDNMPGIVIGMGWVNPNNTIDFYRPTVKLADHTIVYPPQETTTAAPTTTTAKPTTTAVPTTTAKPTTTVAPTTTQAPQEAAPSGYLAQLIGDNIQINYDDTRQAYLYVDGQKQSYTVNNGTQLATSTFTSGQHSFAIAVVTADSYGESEKTTATNINIPEPPTEAPTTTAVPTTTKDYPDGYTKMSYNSWVDLGAWKYKCGDWSAMKAAYKGGDVLNGFSVYIRNSSTAVNNGGAFVVPKFDLEANTKYSYNIIIDTDYSDSTQPLKIMRYVNDSSVGKVVQKSLDNGTNTWTGSFTTADTAGEEIRIDLSYIPKGYTITFTEFSVVKASDPTTQAPTTTVKPTTTVAPTTTVKPTTTVAPTTTVKPTTTVAPTTTAKPTTTAAPTTTVQPTSSDPYSDLTFTDITNNNNDQFDQKLLGSQKAITEGSTFSTLNVCQYQNTRYSELYIAGPWSAANLTATVNGVADSVTIEGAGLRI